MARVELSRTVALDRRRAHRRAVYALLPLVWIISLSLKHPADLNDGKFLPSSVTFDNYTQHLRPGHLHVGAAQLDRHRAHQHAHRRGRSRRPPRTRSPGSTSPASGSCSAPRSRSRSSRRSRWSARCSTSGAASGSTTPGSGLIIPYLTFTLPLAIWLLSAFFREIPWELEQAAQADGATPFQAFRRVIVPLAAPGHVHRRDPRRSSSPGTTSCSRSR